jgi:MFS family permease
MSQLDPTLVAPAPSPEYRKRRKKAILSAYLGFMMDSYAIVVPSIALVPAITYFQVGADANLAALFASITLAATLLGRPVGAFLFGALADRIGRQRIGFITIMGFGVVTLLIASLPGASIVGAPAAMALLVALRFTDGIFLGGEYTAATPLAMEYAPAKRRGLLGGVIQSSSTMGQVIAALLTTIVLAFTVSGDPSSSYSLWGWRIPFIVGGILAIATAVFLRREVDDSDVQKAAPKTRTPLRDLFTPGPNLRALLQVFVIMTGVFFLTNLFGGVLTPAILIRNPDVISAAEFGYVNIIVSLIGVIGYIGSGYLSDRVGRKRALAVGAVFCGIGGPIALFAVGSGTLTSVWAIGAAFLLALLGIGSILGIVPSYFNERFPTAVRSSGWGIGYSTAVIIPSFTAFYIGGLDSFLPTGTGGATLWVFGCILVLIGMTLGPETRGVDLATVRRPVLSEPVRTTTA